MTWLGSRTRRPPSLECGPRLRLPRRPPGPLRRRPHDRARGAGRAARPERRRQDHARAAPQRHPARRRGRGHGRRAPGRASATCAEIRRRVGIVFQDPDDQLFMPTVRDDVAFGPANLGAARRRAGPAGARRAGAVGMRTPPTARRTTSASASAAASRSPPSWPWSRRSSCSTSRPPTSTRRAAASWPRSCEPRRDRPDGHPRPAVRGSSCARARSSSPAASSRRTGRPATCSWTPSSSPRTAWSCRSGSTRPPPSADGAPGSPCREARAGPFRRSPAVPLASPLPLRQTRRTTLVTVFISEKRLM